MPLLLTQADRWLAVFDASVSGREPGHVPNLTREIRETPREALRGDEATEAAAASSRS